MLAGQIKPLLRRKLKISQTENFRLVMGSSNNLILLENFLSPNLNEHNELSKRLFDLKKDASCWFTSTVFKKTNHCYISEIQMWIAVGRHVKSIWWSGCLTVGEKEETNFCCSIDVFFWWAIDNKIHLSNLTSLSVKIYIGWFNEEWDREVLYSQCCEERPILFCSYLNQPCHNGLPSRYIQ